MRFQVTRTSLWDDETPPCEEATKTTVANWDARTFKSPEEHDKKIGRPGKMWADRGTEHQLVYGPRGGVTGIKRRVEDRTAWTIDLADFDALMAFREKYGDLVLTDSTADGAAAIEIYDTWRE